MDVKVECYAGYKGEETPRRIRMDGSTVEVEEVIDRWLAPEYGYFKVRGDDGAVYILRHDAASRAWALVMYDRARPS